MHVYRHGSCVPRPGAACFWYAIERMMPFYASSRQAGRGRWSCHAIHRVSLRAWAKPGPLSTPLRVRGWLKTGDACRMVLYGTACKRSRMHAFSEMHERTRSPCRQTAAQQGACMLTVSTCMHACAHRHGLHAAAR